MTVERIRSFAGAERWQLDYLFDLGFQASGENFYLEI